MRFRSRLSNAVIGTAFGALSVHAQSGVAGPNSGYLFDAPSKSVRLVQGSIGATTLGAPVLDRVDFASISPAGNHAIGCRRGDCFVIVDLNSPELATLPVATNPEAIAWAADGSGAVLYSRTGSWMQTLTGLASTPDAGQVWRVPGQNPLLAVAYDGNRTIIALGGDAGGIFEVTSAGSMVPLANVQTAVSLVAASGSVYALDGGSPAVLRIPLQGGPVDRWNLPLSEPVGLQAGTDAANHAVLYVGGGSDQAVLALDPQTGEVKGRTELAFQPSTLQPLTGGSFLLTSRTSADSVLWSFVPSRGAFFIPAPPAVEDVPARGRRR